MTDEIQASSEQRKQMLADRIKNPTMYEDDRPPHTFEPLLDRIQRDIEDLRTEERLALYRWMEGEAADFLFGGERFMDEPMFSLPDMDYDLREGDGSRPGEGRRS